MNTTNGVHWAIQPHVDEAANALIRTQVDPWLYMEHQGLNVRRVDGTEISYSGIKFEGSPRLVFWSPNYIDPYLVALVDVFVDTTSKKARELRQDVGIVLHDLQGMLDGAIRKVLERMSDVDRRLRGGGFPQTVTPQSIEDRLTYLSGYVAARIKAEYGVELMHARTIMIQSSGKASSLVDTYSTWLMAGLAAFVAVLISNQEKVSKIVTPQMLTACLVVLLLVVVLGIAQKAIAVAVAARGAGELVGRDLAERGEDAVGLSVVVREVLKGSLPVIRRIMRKQLSRTLSGDIAADGRSTFRMAQVQTILVAMQMFLVVFLIGKLAWDSASVEGATSPPRAEALFVPVPQAPLDDCHPPRRRTRAEPSAESRESH